MSTEMNMPFGGQAPSCPVGGQFDGQFNNMALSQCQLAAEQRWSKISLDIQKVKDDQRTMEARLNKQSAMVEDIQQLSKSVSLLASNMDAMLREQQRQGDKLQMLEQKPAKKWENMSDKVVWFLVAAVLGFVLSQIGLG